MTAASPAASRREGPEPHHLSDEALSEAVIRRLARRAVDHRSAVDALVLVIEATIETLRSVRHDSVTARDLEALDAALFTPVIVRAQREDLISPWVTPAQVALSLRWLIAGTASGPGSRDRASLGRLVAALVVEAAANAHRSRSELRLATLSRPAAASSPRAW
jgi:hypothetical protein